MGRLFTAGAEAGTVAVFDSPTNSAVSTVQKRTGAYSFYCSGGTLTCKDLPAAISEFYLRMGIYPLAYNANGGVAFFLDPLANYQLCVIINPANGLICVYSGYFAGLMVVGTHPITLNAWQCIEIRVKISSDVGTGRIVVKIDGTPDIDFTGVTQFTAQPTVQTVYFMYGSPYTSTQGYFDDIAINDTAGAVNNSWIGRGGIYPKYITGVGAYTDLIAQGHANPWDCISEVPPDDADYVYESTVDKKSTYAGSTLTPTTGTIACINVIMRAKLDAVGTGNIARLIRSNGVDGQGADVGLDVTAKMIQENIETDPSGGAAWTIARVNALEAGAVVR